MFLFSTSAELTTELLVRLCSNLAIYKVVLGPRRSLRIIRLHTNRSLDDQDGWVQLLFSLQSVNFPHEKHVVWKSLDTQKSNTTCGKLANL